MNWPLAAGLWIASWPALAQNGTRPREKPADYPATAQAGSVAIGAEYLVHTFTDSHGAYHVPDYLVVEVALYPAKGQTLAVTTGEFTLRINGRKSLLYAQAPAFVAASLKYPDWDWPRAHPEITAGPVVIGRPRPTARFPGDRRDPDTQLPPQPQAPDARPGGIEKGEKPSADQVALETALPEGECREPVSGYLYFAYRGKPKSIKSLELLWNAAGHALTLKLF